MNESKKYMTSEEIESILERTYEILWKRFYSNIEKNLHSLFFKDAQNFTDFYLSYWKFEEAKELRKKWATEERYKIQKGESHGSKT